MPQQQWTEEQLEKGRRLMERIYQARDKQLAEEIEARKPPSSSPQQWSEEQLEKGQRIMERIRQASDKMLAAEIEARKQQSSSQAKILPFRRPTKFAK